MSKLARASKLASCCLKRAFVLSFLLSGAGHTISIQLPIPGVPSINIPDPVFPVNPSIPNMPPVAIPDPSSIGQIPPNPPTGPESTGEKPVALLSFIETNLGKSDGKNGLRRASPFQELIDVSAYETFVKNWATCKKPGEAKKNPAACPTYEYYVPYPIDLKNPTKSSVELSREVAQIEQKAWQVFQEKSHWRLEIELNKSLLHVGVTPSPSLPFEQYSTACALPTRLATDIAADTLRGTVPGGGMINPPLPEVKISVPQNITGKGFKAPSGFNYGMQDPEIDLNQLPFPRVPVQEYCWDINWTPLTDNTFPVPPTAMYTAGTSYLGIGPKILYFNWPEMRYRLQTAADDIARTYYPEYVKTVLEEFGRRMPLAIAWDGFFKFDGKSSGKVFAPVTHYTQSQITDLMNIAKKSGDPTAYSVLFGVGKTTTANGTVYLQDRTRKQSPGVWKIEELKRWLKPGNLLEQERFGNTTMFYTWYELDTVMDVRPLVYHAVGFNIPCPIFCGPKPVPQPQIAYDVVIVPGKGQVLGTRGGTTTFVVPRFKFAWSSVPEGYAIPFTRGKPDEWYKP